MVTLPAFPEEEAVTNSILFIKFFAFRVTLPPAPLVKLGVFAIEKEYTEEESVPKILPLMAERIMFPPFPALPDFEYEYEFSVEGLIEISPVMVDKEIAPPFPELAESEAESERK